MKISANKRFSIEEFEAQQRTWIGRLIAPLNNFIEQIIQAMSQGLTLADNLKAQKIELKISANQVYPIKQLYTLNEKPFEVRLAQIREATGAVPAAPVLVHWELLNSSLQISLVGLDSSKAYTVYLTAQV